MRKICLLLTLAALLLTVTNCNNSDHDKQKALQLKETELQKREQNLDLQQGKYQKTPISTKDAVMLAEKQFENYLPKIVETNKGRIDVQQSYTGDFTGDGIEDVVIFFSLSPEDGGNTIIAQGLTLYQNTGRAVKVIAGFDPDYLFSFSRISKGKIYVEKLEYAETDGRCCPSIKTTHILKISGNKAY